MAGFYDEMADVALAMIDEFGLTYTMKRTTPGVQDPVEGLTYDNVDSTQDIKAIKVPVNQTIVDQLETKFTAESLTVSNVVMLKAAAKDMTMAPAAGDVVVVDGNELPIVAYTLVKPADVPLVYTLALKL